MAAERPLHLPVAMPIARARGHGPLPRTAAGSVAAWGPAPGSAGRRLARHGLAGVPCLVDLPLGGRVAGHRPVPDVVGDAGGVPARRLLAGGCSNQEIGLRLHISANTAANHVRSILMKTGAANRTQAAMYAAQRNLV